MPFEKVETAVDFPSLERAILKFWDENGIFEKRRALNAGRPKWSFLDGPITANNPMGVHHAWGRTYKDAYNRYFAMTGHELRYQQGFDCQGLWVEVEVEKSLGLKSKRDIENLVPGDPFASIDKFVQACKDRVNKFARVQTDQSIRLGYWMNWDRTDADWAKSPDERKSYFTMAEENNYTIWAFLKKCHSKKLIYRGYDVMPWCGRCGVGISEMEMKEGYRLVEHRACFVKFPLKNRENENLLVWTTTPWTLTSNVGATINPELTYLKVKLKGDLYYVAKGAFKLNRMESSGGEDEDDGEVTATASRKKREWLDGVPHINSIEQHFKQKAGKDGYEVVGEVKGADLLGWEYVGPFDDLPAQQHEYGFPEDVAKVTKQSGKWPAKTAAASHRVISGGDDVTETEGTGIVHTAPGCGQIDYRWGEQNGLPPVAPIGDDGCFHTGFGPLTGKNAADASTADAVFEELKKKDRLFATERYVHRYPHCWRCKTELLYRLVDEWFINMGERLTEEGFRGDIMKVVRNPEVKFLPESLNGTARELDWLRNMGDWMISKKRYWGLSLPIWVDEKDPTQFEVIGSREELKERAVEGWEEFEGHTPHRPWVDQVKIRNPRTGNLMSRIPDVGNPWLDAGIVAFSTLKYNTDRKYWEKWYPADFITESFPGQFRNWFYALLALSTMMSDGKPPFKTLLGHGLVRDQEGKEMHKSEGNSLEFIAAADEGFTLTHKLKPNEKPKKPEGALSFTETEIFDKENGKTVKAICAAYPAIGADVMRWLYCRNNPAANVNFGPIPANEVRAKFHIKLWNCYAFFCNYARLDGFDPSESQVPMMDRPDIDRWILLDLQGLIRSGRKDFERYDVMAFCLEAERFVDDRLSNWYVRRNRDRFWSKKAQLDAAGKRDKLSAYQTMHEVLKTLMKLIAPIVPFLSELIWQNIRSSTDAESVHLCDYPKPSVAEIDESIEDRELLEAMRGLMRLVSYTMSLRNQAKQKVRQPLATLIIQTGNQGEMLALKRFRDQLLEEINVKQIQVYSRTENNRDLLDYDLKPNLKKLLEWDKDHGRELFQKLQKGEFKPPSNSSTGIRLGGTINLPHARYDLPFDTVYQWKSPEGKEGWEYFAVGPSYHTQLLLDTRITPELKAEGLARDVVRFVQDARKDAGLDVEDKIELFLGSESTQVKDAITAHQTYIASETQITEWSDTPLDGEAYTVTVKVDGVSLTISLRKV